LKNAFRPAGNAENTLGLFFSLPTPFSPIGGIFVLKGSTGFLLVKINFIVTHAYLQFKQKMPKNKFFLRFYSSAMEILRLYGNV